jgi:hypothetical protein
MMGNGRTLLARVPPPLSRIECKEMTEETCVEVIGSKKCEVAHSRELASHAMGSRA